jgi:thiamine-monophosphate kinase
MKVSELGEFGLIDLLARMIAEKEGRKAPPDLILGIGDDAAVWRGDKSLQIATVDTMVEGVHFSPDTATWPEVGWKSLAINLSDIAAMGGEPRYALVAISLPSDTEVDAVAGLYEGMLALAGESGTTIAGGNVSRAPQVTVTVTVLGSSPNGEVLRRDAAHPGDIIAVTGYAGSAAAGLKMLQDNLKLPEAAAAYLRNAFLRPQPCLAEGRLLLSSGIRAAIDTSDGLVADLGHICQASRTGARINADSLPVHPAVREHFGAAARDMALGGGEDYELLFTGPAQVVDRIKSEAGCPVTVIGEITDKPEKIEVTDSQGRPVAVDIAGWTHF